MCLQALEAVEGEKWTLEGQKTEMLRQQQRHLAWSGQALIANSVSVMEEAVDQIRATFLFTSKELKYAQLYKGSPPVLTSCKYVLYHLPLKGARHQLCRHNGGGHRANQGRLLI